MKKLPATGILAEGAAEVFKRREFARWQARVGLADDALRFAGRVFLDLEGAALAQALAIGVLQEVSCEETQDRRRAS